MIKHSLKILAVFLFFSLFLGEISKVQAQPQQVGSCDSGAITVEATRNGQSIPFNEYSYSGGDLIKINFNGVYTSGFTFGNYNFFVWNGTPDGWFWLPSLDSSQPDDKLYLNGQLNGSASFSIPPGTSYEVRITDLLNTSIIYCPFPFTVGDDPATPEEGQLGSSFSLCEQIPSKTTDGQPNPAVAQCNTCLTATQPPGIWTSLGCIQTGPRQMITTILRIGLGMAGGVALLIILAAAFMFSISQGEPKRVSEARDMLTAAIIGLLFIIFSVTILQFIGVNLLQIPGFGSNPF